MSLRNNRRGAIDVGTVYNIFMGVSFFALVSYAMGREDVMGERVLLFSRFTDGVDRIGAYLKKLT